MDRFEAAFVAILLLGAGLRFYGLSERPLHSDEAVHAHFTFELPTRYTYDPIYHGPFLYHITALSFAALGASPFSLRLPQVLFGIGLIALLWPLRKEQHLGKTGVLISALLIAVSPSFVYYSRFAIHESFFAFFTLGTIVSCILYSESKKKNQVYLYLAAAMLALLFTAKESAYPVAAIFAVSAFLSFGTPQLKPKHVLVACIVFAFIFAFFYSSMFRNQTSLGLGITAPVKTWLEKAENWTGHQKPAIFYVSLLVIYELPILLFGLAGLTASPPIAGEKNNRFFVFVSLWALLTMAVYFLMKYKTPWLIVNMALPLALMAGAFAEKAIRNRAIAVMFILTLAFSAAAMARVNFEKSADPSEPLVYVQTSSDVSRLVKIVDGLALEKGADEQLTISVVSTDYWPLPFYFRNYGAGYWTGDAPGQISADVVLSSTANEKKVEGILGTTYNRVGVFKLREWYGAGYTLEKLYKFLLDGSGYNSTGSFDLALYLKK